MKLHLIQDMVTGMRLPYGGTSAEFTNNLPPRLFSSRAAALTALRMWRQGHWRTVREFESYSEYGDGAYVQGLPAPSDAPYNVDLAVRRQARAIQVRPVRLEVG